MAALEAHLAAAGLRHSAFRGNAEIGTVSGCARNKTVQSVTLDKVNNVSYSGRVGHGFRFSEFGLFFDIAGEAGD
jgi:hypothetical protein